MGSLDDKSLYEFWKIFKKQSENDEDEYQAKTDNDLGNEMTDENPKQNNFEALQVIMPEYVESSTIIDLTSFLNMYLSSPSNSLAEISSFRLQSLHSSTSLNKTCEHPVMINPSANKVGQFCNRQFIS